MIRKTLLKILESNTPRPTVQAEENMCVHIFSASSTLVGVCLTVIGIIRLIINQKGLNTLADDFLVVDALVFLGACLLSYWAFARP